MLFVKSFHEAAVSVGGVDDASDSKKATFAEIPAMKNGGRPSTLGPQIGKVSDP
jgi:hypothetical protein